MKIQSNSNIPKVLVYVKEELGVELDPSMPPEKIIQEAKKLQAEQGITQTKNVKTELKGKTDSPGKIPKAVIVNIAQTQAQDEDSEPETHCIMGFNGRNYQVAFGEDVEIPYGVYSALKDAVQTKYTKVKGDGGKTRMVPKQVQRFPFSTIEKIY